MTARTSTANYFFKILLLEPDIHSLGFIQMAMKAEGFHTHPTSKQTYLDDLRRLQPDLLLINYDGLDVPLSGLTTLQRFGNDLGVHKFFLILASAADDLEAQAIYYNADAFIKTPYELVDLCNSIKDILSI